ncbi:MAG TPA: alginate lyase family protein [Vicinamibacterales bacterium]|nr:alginate lyase family protein [Vicinamibacterales bacterium]
MTTLLRRLRAMDGAELRFRAASVLRSRVDRARAALAPETWRRGALQLADLPGLAAARDALERERWLTAHREMARYFVERPPRFPLPPHSVAAIASEVARRFPHHDALDRAERIRDGHFDLLGYRDVFAGSPPDWHADPVHGRRAPLAFWDTVPYLDPVHGDHKVIWEINRHQHFLALGRAYALSGDDRFYRAFVAHLMSWVDANPPLTGTNWASMLELGFRCLSWLWSLHFFAPAVSEGDDQPWIVDLLMALDRQLTHVEQNLSRYFSPNTHLTGEALALYVAGRVLPELPRSAQREAVGRDVLLAEAHRQVYPDGGHAERSAHYHRYSTDFYLLALAVARLTGDSAEPAFAEAARRQARFLRALADDTGRLPLIGDDDGGQLFPICGRPPCQAAPSLWHAAILLGDASLAAGAIPEEAYWLCGATNALPDGDVADAFAPSVAFPDTGYYISRDREGNHLVFDCGRHGYLNGGHAHADALSIVATVAGRPLLVDPGTGTYTMDAVMRDRFRSTAMHNTVVVDGRSQSLPRGPFHWTSATDARCVLWRPGDRADYAEGRHAGYAPITHARVVVTLHGAGWLVIDHLLGPATEVQADTMWHVPPGWRVRELASSRVQLADDQPRAVLAASSPLEAVTEEGLDAYAPEYGRIEQGLCFRARRRAAAPFSIATFVSAAPAWATVGVVEMRLVAEPGDGWHGSAFRIDTAHGTLIAVSAVELDDTCHHPAPAHPWGPEGFQTLHRAVVLHLTPCGADELCHVGAAALASSMHSAERQ